MWYIICQSPSSVYLVYLTSSYSKCKKKYEKLEMEIKSEEERDTFYYMGLYKK